MGDQSVWTDTPADKQRKREAAAAGRAETVAKKPVVKPVTDEEREIAEAVESYNKQIRSEALIDIHAEKRKKTMPAESTARRPFDRERDLNITQTDPKKKADFIKGASKLNSKFSSGSYESSFL